MRDGEKEEKQNSGRIKSKDITLRMKTNQKTPARVEPCA